jgi:hypothetical protein
MYLQYLFIPDIFVQCRRFAFLPALYLNLQYVSMLLCFVTHEYCMSNEELYCRHRSGIANIFYKHMLNYDTQSCT